jgi:glycosyltransferase involved in cell wall biosynthesis
MTAPPRPRILWLTKGLGLGGSERLIHLSVQAIDRARFDIELAYVLPGKDALVEPIQKLGIVVRCLGEGHRRPRRWLRNLARLLRSQPYEIVHTHSPLIAAAARIIPATGRPVFVHTEHSAWSRYRWLTHAANSATYGRNAMVFAVSDAVMRSIDRPLGVPLRGAPRVEVLHHGIDETLIRGGLDVWTKARRRLGRSEGDLVVGTVGSMTAKKDQATLLRAFAGVRRAVADVHLVVVGGGPLEGELRSLANALELNGSVCFLGVRKDVQELLPGLDLFALSSKHEGLGLALLEAMAAGVPCVATNVEGIPEVVTDGFDGLLVPPGDPGALAEALLRLLRDPKLREKMGRRAVSSSKRFSIQRAVRRLEDRYDELLLQGRP